MTAITLNLLAEQQLAQVERARDPVKIFIAVGLSVLAALVAWASILSIIAAQRKAELRGLQSRWEKMNALGDKEVEFQQMRAFAEGIVAVNHSRVLVAPQLAMVKDVIPQSILLSRLGFAVVVETPSSDAGGGDAASNKRKAHPRSVERLMLRLEGTASSSRPELEVDQFLRTLRTDPQFSAVIDDIQLRSISRSTGDASGKDGHTLLAADFVIECRYKEMANK